MNILLFLLFLFTSTLPLSADFAHRIDSYSDFEHFSNQVERDRFTKFVIDLETNQIYFFNVNIYELHKDFVFKGLLKKDITVPLLIEFHKNYDEKKPRYLLGYLVHHLNQNIWTFGFWEGDQVTCNHIELAHQRLNETFFSSHELCFQPLSSYQEKVASSLVKIPVITSDTLYRLSDYQPITCGEAVGILRLIKEVAEPESLVFSSDEIVVLAVLLPDITPVAGIITEQFATPLSHLSLRSRNWGIPNIGLKDALCKLEAYSGQHVSFTATRSGYEIRLATNEEITRSIKTKPEFRLPSVDLNQKELKALTKLERCDAAAFGTKASNLGEIAGKFRVPAGFAIPMFYYAKHIQESGVEEQINKVLESKADLKRALEKIREKIIVYPLNPALLEIVWLKVQRLAASGVFVRSSTNAEDLAGFNGAGLYDTVGNVNSKEMLEKAIKQVWASVWNLRAFSEREHHNIDHKSVFGAVLVQAGINATSAGVLITKDISDPTETMEVYTINAKWGLGEGVVSGCTIPEQILFNLDNGGIKVLSRASDENLTVFDERGGLKSIPNPKSGQPVLSDSQATELAWRAFEIKALFPDEDALDIEWLFKGNTLHIVQVRPL